MKRLFSITTLYRKAVMYGNAAMHSNAVMLAQASIHDTISRSAFLKGYKKVISWILNQVQHDGDARLGVV